MLTYLNQTKQPTTDNYVLSVVGLGLGREKGEGSMEKEIKSKVGIR